MHLILTSMFLFVDVLIPHLANVNVTDRAGRTSLHHAAFNGHVEVQIMCAVHSKVPLNLCNETNCMKLQSCILLFRALYVTI